MRRYHRADKSEVSMPVGLFETGGPGLPDCRTSVRKRMSVRNGMSVGKGISVRKGMRVRKGMSVGKGINVRKGIRVKVFQRPVATSDPNGLLPAH